MPQAETPMERVRRSLTITEIGVIFSTILSVLTATFMFGVLYGQVQRNTVDIKDFKNIPERVARIETGVQFLVDEAKKDTHQ